IIFDTSASMTLTSACSQADTFNDVDPFDAMCTQECTLDDPTCSRLCPSQGCREYAIVDPDNPIVELEEIILDNDAGAPAVTFSGTWGTLTAPDFFKGPDFRYDLNTGEGGLSEHRTATYNPTISNAGTYMVYMTYPISTVTATNVMVDVTHVGGTDTVSMDQANTVESGAGTDFDGWNLIGTFELDATADSGTVVIRNEMADYNVVADAIRWVRIDVPPCLDASDLIYRCQQPICPLGDCYAQLNGDDPNSKFYQAKQALYDAIESVDNVHFGFGSY
ncbi:MAG: hypothetical protein GY708_13890, partial [Actinomycetia bacterium]|nr:hypothetical protein [Actinomycetes bacterium]